MKKFISLLLAATLVLSLAACGASKTENSASPSTSPSQAAEETVTDSHGNTFKLPMKLKNVIVLNSSVYEMICALGKDDVVTGVSNATVYPASAKDKTQYGDWRKPDVEKILAAKPDAVIGYASWLDSGISKQLTDAGIPVIMLDFYVPSKIPDEMLTLGKLFGAEDRAKEFNDDMKKIQDTVAENTKDVTQTTVYYEGYSDYKSVGKGSGGDELMKFANVKSLTGDQSTEYPQISDEWVLQQNPQMIVKLVSDTKKILGPDVMDDAAVKDLYSKIAARPGWNKVDAIANKKVLILSSRIGTCPLGSAIAPLFIAKSAYPDKFKDVDPQKMLEEMYKKYWGTDLTGIWSYTD